MSASALELPQLVGVGGQAAAMHRHDHAEADGDLAGGDDHDDDREDLAVAVAPHAAERDQREVRRVEHQLEAEQHDERVAARHHAGGADGEDDRAAGEVPADGHGYQPASRSPSPPWSRTGVVVAPTA